MNRIILSSLLVLFTTTNVLAATATIILPVQAAKLPSSNPAAVDAGETNWRLLFDADRPESACWQFRMPADYSSNPALKLLYSMQSAATNKVEFEVSVMAVSAGDSADINTEGYDRANSGSVTVPGTAGDLDEISITLTNADSLAAGDFVKLKLTRDADDGTNDTASADAEVVAISLEYTTD